VVRKLLGGKIVCFKVTLNNDGDGTFADNIMYVYTNLRLKLQSQFIVLASALPPTSAVRNCHK